MALPRGERMRVIVAEGGGGNAGEEQQRLQRLPD